MTASQPATPGSDVALRPTCPNGHGLMTLRASTVGTPEQQWCGTWYDCTPAAFDSSCRSAALLPSPELLGQLDEQASR